MGSATATRSCGSTDRAARLSGASLGASVTAFGAAALLASVTAPAHAQRVIGEARAGGGYDSNPAAAADPGNRRLPQGGPGRPTSASMEDGVVRLGGFVGAEVGDEQLGGFARFDLDGRVYGAGDAMFWERLRVGALLRLESVTPRCALDGERFDSSFGDDDAWTLVGSCGARVELPVGFHIDADALAGGRFYDVAQMDALYGGVVTVGWTLGPVSVALSMLALRRDSDVGDAARTELSPRVGARLDTEHVGAELGYRFVARQFDQASRTGTEHVGRLVAWAMPVAWLGAYAEVELGYAEGGSQALAYERVQVVGGVRLALDWHPEPDGLPEPADAQGPATVLDDGRVRFRFQLPDATHAAVVGDFNDWDAEAGRLQLSEGAFEGTFSVPPGRHEYALIVDGEPRRPPGAPRYVRDDFGSENAVLVIVER